MFRLNTNTPWCMVCGKLRTKHTPKMKARCVAKVRAGLALSYDHYAGRIKPSPAPSDVP